MAGTERSAGDVMKPGFEKRAYIEIVRPKPKDPTKSKIPLCFNPTEYQRSKQNTFQDVPIPGLGAPPIQFIRGGSEKLIFDATVDSSDDMANVNERYVKPLRALLDIDGSIHAPPIVKVVWKDLAFEGVIESLNVTFSLFAEDGTPIRAKLGFSIREYTTVEQQKAKAKATSPDVEKTYIVQRGDTLTAIAEQAYGDPAPWRTIARANGLADPRVLEPGSVLTIPRLEVAR